MQQRHEPACDGCAAGILEVLTLVAGDKAEKVQRRATAALGELLFYIATQVQSSASGTADSSPSLLLSVWLPTLTA